jgi:hypothetical protein
MTSTSTATVRPLLTAAGGRRPRTAREKWKWMWMWLRLRLRSILRSPVSRVSCLELVVSIPICVVQTDRAVEEPTTRCSAQVHWS